MYMLTASVRSPRRGFLQMMGGAAASLSLAWAGLPSDRQRRKVRFGAIADVHKDVMHDADGRLKTFIAAARERGSDFIIQLGDFCRPYDKNREFLRIWDSFGAGPRHHVLGNHENDGGFSWEQVLTFLGMPRPYYSFDVSGWHFVVLNGNERDPASVPKSGYPRYVGREQVDWLAEDLARAGGPTMVFSHQSLEDGEGIENGARVREVLEGANKAAGWRKVGACLCGHHHVDFHRELNGIHYVQINSASYSWLGSEYQHVRYSAEVDREHPYIKYTAPYALPLFAMVTLRPEGRMEIRGRRSRFVGPSPWDLGMKDESGTSRDRGRLRARISDRVLQVGMSRARGRNG
jgi:hypothetical protein